MAAMNGCLLKEVEAGKEMVIQLKAAAKAAPTSTDETARWRRGRRSVWGRCATP